ncbi:MAG: sulfotransferase [Actinomycetota bacterium]|nr:sulfotransferase [Actinomycetota bacterium]MDQ2980986.1 sulfotransferase [Actinomycetota bacterium]
MNPYVFIVGCPRSGTTLLQRMVDAHPEIAIIHETHWIPKLFKRRKGVTNEGLVTAELLPALLSQGRVPDLGIEPEEVERLIAENDSLSYKDLVTALFDLYGDKRGKRLVGDKTPGYTRAIETLHELWPAAKFVHMIRDGRDVCLSAINWHRRADHFRRRFSTWDEDPITTAALWWRWHVLCGRMGMPLGAERYYELRYEALVDDPEGECTRLCAFLGLRFDEAMLRFHEGHTRSEPGLSAKHAWLPPTAGLRNWRTEMPSRAIERFETAAGDLLDDLGYERAATKPRGDCLEQVAMITRRFREDSPSPKRPLPRGL